MNVPLATRIRPVNLNEFYGQEDLIGEGRPLREVVKTKKIHSMILWGPPGSGKTTLARILAKSMHAEFVNLSAVMVGLREVREVMQEAKERLKQNISTVLFMDEVHRFNKTQQDAFLPYIEDGTITFIGATTENPSFELNNALLSRCRVYVLKPLTDEDLLKVIDRALSDPNGFLDQKIDFSKDLRKLLVQGADGDARQALNLLELVVQHTKPQNKIKKITKELIEKAISFTLRRFDKGGEDFYNQISALHKAVRGSSPDGALYWFARMLDGGCDPLYIARRVVRMASEDIGNARPEALTLALNAWEAQERLGSPEGELAIAQAIVFLAVSPKSNAVYTAFKEAQKDAEFRSYNVPVHLRNAPTKLMKSLEYGKAYRYDHDEENAFAVGQTYFPEEMGERIYYHPVDRGLEIKIGEKLAELRILNKNYRKK